MKLYSFPISGRLLVPANSDDEATAVAADTNERLQILFEECVEKSHGEGALGGGVLVGKNPQAYAIDQRTVQRMAAQIEAFPKEPRRTTGKRGKRGRGADQRDLPLSEGPDALPAN